MTNGARAFKMPERFNWVGLNARELWAIQSCKGNRAPRGSRKPSLTLKFISDQYRWWRCDDVYQWRRSPKSSHVATFTGQLFIGDKVIGQVVDFNLPLLEKHHESK